MAGNIDNFELVDSIEKVSEALSTINSHSIISVDCEGVQLSRNGELCLVQIAIPSKSFLFDIVQLRDQLFDAGLRKILEDPGVTKRFYDCREDCNALQHQFNVNVQGIEDIQILTAMSMKLSGKTVKFVTGLRKCIDYNLKGCGFSSFEKEKVFKELERDITLWKKRPLTDGLMTYAIKDVKYLSALRDKVLTRMGTQVPHSTITDAVKYASTRYADFMRNNDGYPDDSPYFRTARIPERILPELSRNEGRWTITQFPVLTGSRCRSCYWETVLRPDGQCRRCYLIDVET